MTARVVVAEDGVVRHGKDLALPVDDRGAERAAVAETDPLARFGERHAEKLLEFFLGEGHMDKDKRKKSKEKAPDTDRGRGVTGRARVARRRRWSRSDCRRR